MKVKSVYAAVVAVLALLLGLGYSFWRADRAHSRHDNPFARAHSPPPLKADQSPDGSAVAGANDGATLDQIAGASLQQVHALLASRSRENIIRLAQQLRELQPGALSNAKISLFFKAWAQIDPASALQIAMGFGGWIQRVALEAVADGVEPAGASAFIAAIRQVSPELLSSSLRQHLIEKGIVRWAQDDPVAAAEVLASLPKSDVSRQAWLQVAESLAARDPAAALSWVQKNDDQETVSAAMQGLMSGWWQKDPAAAEAYARANSYTLVGQRAASVLANRMAATNPEKAAAWAAQLSNPDARAMSELTVAAAWAYRDPGAASRWIEALTQAEGAMVSGTLSSVWARNDPAGAARWISSLTGEVRDSAIAGYTSVVALSNPADALGWALSIGDEQMRTTTAIPLATKWLARQPEAARQWIEASDLSPAEKSRLLDGRN
jgi:hypothetical protein